MRPHRSSAFHSLNLLSRDCMGKTDYIESDENCGSLLFSFKKKVAMFVRIHSVLLCVHKDRSSLQSGTQDLHNVQFFFEGVVTSRTCNVKGSGKRKESFVGGWIPSTSFYLVNFSVSFFPCSSSCEWRSAPLDGFPARDSIKSVACSWREGQGTESLTWNSR